MRVPLSLASRVVVLCGVIAAPACATRPTVPTRDVGTGTGDDTGVDDTGSADDAGASVDACGAATDPSRVHCASIYTITGTSPPALYRFDPTCLVFQRIGDVSCPTGVFPATPFSMAVSQDGVAWVLYTNGRLYNVDVHTAACAATTYAANQHGFNEFGMGFAANASGAGTETLYVSHDSTPFALASIDLASLTLTPIGNYDALSARAELSGTGDARLFGAFEGTPFVVAEIDPSSAHIVSQAPQSVGMASSNFAFAAYGGDFYLFVGPGSFTDVYRYRPSTGASEAVVTHFAEEIVGAGVSTCAPF